MITAAAACPWLPASPPRTAGAPSGEGLFTNRVQIPPLRRTHDMYNLLVSECNLPFNYRWNLLGGAGYPLTTGTDLLRDILRWTGWNEGVQ